jgi:hypothetical protein
MDIFVGINKYFQRRVVGQSIYCNSPENFDSGGEGKEDEEKVFYVFGSGGIDGGSGCRTGHGGR